MNSFRKIIKIKNRVKICQHVVVTQNLRLIVKNQKKRKNNKNKFKNKFNVQEKVKKIRNN